MKKLTLVVLVFAVVGCTGMSSKHYLSMGPDTTVVNCLVDLDKEYIQGMSSLAAGQLVMFYFAGPFTNNAVLLEAVEKSEYGEQIAFRQRLTWGKNEFRSVLKQGTVYELKLVLQGTRTGEKVIGTMPVQKTSNQNVTISLHGNSTYIK